MFTHASANLRVATARCKMFRFLCPHSPVNLPRGRKRGPRSPPCLACGPHMQHSDARRSPLGTPRLACLASSGRTGGPPMQGEAISERRGWNALHLRATRAALRCQAKPPRNATAGLPCIFGPHGRPSDARRGSRGSLPQACFASSGRTGGPPVQSKPLGDRTSLQFGIASHCIFGPHGRPFDKTAGRSSPRSSGLCTAPWRRRRCALEAPPLRPSRPISRESSHPSSSHPAVARQVWSGRPRRGVVSAVPVCDPVPVALPEAGQRERMSRCSDKLWPSEATWAIPWPRPQIGEQLRVQVQTGPLDELVMGHVLQTVGDRDSDHHGRGRCWGLQGHVIQGSADVL